MKKRLVLITSCLIAAMPALANESYQHCLEGAESKVCKAYLAGLSEQAEPESLEATETHVVQSKAGHTFLDRALEQRAGERLRKSLEHQKG